MKHLEGKTVWLRPTGNNARRYNGKIITGFIEKVSRVNAIVIVGERRTSGKFRIAGLHIYDGYNGGYDVYESEQELVDKLRLESISQKMHNAFPYPRSYESVPLDTLIKVAELLGVDIADMEER